MTTGICDKGRVEKGRVEKRVELWTPWGVLQVATDDDARILSYRERDGRWLNQCAIATSSRSQDPAPRI